MKLSFLRDLGVVSSAHALAGLFALVYTILVSRRLGVADYGLFQAVMAIYSTLTAFGGPLSLATIHSISIADDAVRPLVVGRFLRFAIIVGGICGGGLVCASHWLSGVLDSSVFPILWVALLIPVTALLSTFYGAVLAYNAFFLYGAVKVAEGLIVLSVGFVLVRAGAGVSGAVLGYVFGMLSTVIFFLARRQFYSLRKGAVSIPAEVRTFVNILLVYGAIYLVSDLPVALARSRLGAVESGLYGSLHNLRQLVLPFCFALSVPLYSRAVAAPIGHGAFLQVLALVSGLGGAFLAIGIFAPRLPFLLIYGPAYAEASRYMVVYGVALGLQMFCIVTMFYQVARKKIVRIHLLVPVVVLVTASVLPTPSIPRLVLAQVIAWGCYLVVTLVSSGVSRFSHRKAMVFPGAKAEIVRRRKAE